MRFLLFIFGFLIINNSIDKTLSVNLCKKLRPTFAEIFGEKWENEIIGENENQNQNETDQNGNFNQNDQNELSGQTEKMDFQQKNDIIHKFDGIKEGIKKWGKYSAKVWVKTEQKIAKKLGISRMKIYKWKKEFRLNLKNDKNYYEKKKSEFIVRIDEFKRMCKKGKQKQFAEELGIDRTTLSKWKKEFGIEIGTKGANRYYKKEKMSKMNDYYEMKKGNPSLSDKEIASHLKIGTATLKRWKKEKKS